jgi:hypothetical protein
MSVILPSSVSYGESLPALPDNTQCINIATAPTNGASFTSGQQIYLDLVNRGFLVPDSMYLSYSYVLASAAGAAGVEIMGCPAATSFNRLDVQVGSQTIDTIQNYNIFYHMLTNVTYDVAQKYGNQAALGYFNSTAAPSLEQLDGRVCVANETGSFAIPLVSLLSNSEKLIPLFAMPQVRIVLTMESLASMFTAAVGVTSWTISNVQLRYKVVDFGGAVEQIVLGSSDKLYIKSQSFALASQTLAANSSGYIELVFNQRYASVKSLFAINGNGTIAGTNPNSNKAYDSVDLTSSNGDYSFMVGGVMYPPTPINTKTAKTQALLELKSAVGSIFDKSNNMAINSIEFGYNAGTASVTSVSAPAKFYVGTSLEKLNSSNLLTGISTQNSPISYRINTGTSIGAANSTITLVANYDALIEVDCVTRQVSVKC